MLSKTTQDVVDKALKSVPTKKVFEWLKENQNLESVNYYIPSQDKNLDHFPCTIEVNLKESGFYCFATLQIDGIHMIFRFYEASELECDISPKDIDCISKVEVLLNLLAKVQDVVNASRYIICPETFKDGVFNINGEFIS